MNSVSAIIETVRQCGDNALRMYKAQYDNLDRAIDMPWPRIEVASDGAYSVPLSYAQAVTKIITSLTKVQQNLYPPIRKMYLDDITISFRWEPIASIGLYVPKNYYSTLIHGVIPAKCAGVANISCCTPYINNKMAYIAQELNIKLYEIGGPAAIAAMAYGTETVPKVDKIVGPGSDMVQEAKRQLFGVVGIDMISGPSELVSSNQKDITAVFEHIGASRIGEDRAEIVREVLMTDTAKGKTGYGAIYENTTHVLGDYCAGISHILPTGNACRWASGLSVYDFLRLVPIIKATKDGLRNVKDAVITMAMAEGMNKHADCMEAWCE